MELGHITLDEKTRSQSNTLILGPPGFGKSFFLLYMMLQDLARRIPFCLIDLHGTLYEKLVKFCVFFGYDNRRIVLVDLCAGAFVKGIKSFRKKVGLDVSAHSSGLVDAVLRVWGLEKPDAYPVIYKLTKILFTVMVEKDIPLNVAFQLFANRSRFARVVSQLEDPLIKALWADLEKLTQSEWSRQVTPTVNKLFRIVQSKAIQRFLCLPGEHNLDLTFEDTILVNLATSGTLDADAARTFAALLLNDLYQSAKRRKGKAGKDPAPYYVYCDEWWLVPTPDVGRILAETRKHGLLLTLANQDLSQIKAAFGGEFAQSILTLCQVQCCFGGLNHSDATRLSKEWGLEVEAVQRLAERQCLVKLPRRPASLITVPDVKEPYLRPEKISQFEERIACATGAIPVEQADALLAHSSSAQERLDDTIDGYAVV